MPDNFDDPVFQRKMEKLIKKLEKTSDKDLPEAISRVWKRVRPKVTKDFVKKNYKLWGTLWDKGLQQSYINGVKKTSFSTAVLKPGIVHDMAGEYFENHGLELVKTLTETDITKLKGQMIKNWGMGEDAFAKEYKDSYSVSPSRIKTIFRTEHHKATNFGVLEVSKRLGRSYKQWIVIEDERTCPICGEHVDDTVPIDEPFQIIDKDGNVTEIEIPNESHPSCFDEQTEVFTENGWKLFKDVIDNERIWTLNIERNEIELDNFVHRIEYPYSGDMVHFKSKTLDCMVTPDHNMLVLPRGQPDDGIIIHKQANTLVTSDRILRSSDNWIGNSPEKIKINNREFDTSDFVQFLGWYISEGSISKPKNGRWQIKITQSKEENRRKIIDLCNRMFEKLWIGKEAIYIPHVDDIYEYFLALGHAQDKYIPYDIKQLSKEYLKILLDALIGGDGTVRKSYWKDHPEWKFHDDLIYFTTSNKLVSDLTEIALKLGMRPSFSTIIPREIQHRNGKYTSKYLCYRLSFAMHKYATISKYMIKNIDYSGNVYCLEMAKNHTLYVRRNGKANWSGNCRCTMITLREKDLTEEQKQMLIEKGYMEPEEEPVDQDGEEWTPRDEYPTDEYVKPEEMESGQKENSTVKLNYKCPKGTVDPDTFSCGKTPEESKKNYEKIQKDKKESNKPKPESTDNIKNVKSLLEPPAPFRLDDVKVNPKSIEDAVRNVSLFHSDSAHIDEQPKNVQKEYVKYVKGAGIYKEAKEIADTERYKFSSDNVNSKWENIKDMKWKDNSPYVGRNDLYTNEIINDSAKNIIYNVIDEYSKNENFPPMRGIVSRMKMDLSEGVPLTAYAANGDGILILNEPMIINAMSATKESIINIFKDKFESNVKFMRENINKQKDADYDMQQRLASAASFVNRNAETYNSVVRDRDEKLMPWNYNKDQRTFALKPISVMEYFEKPEDKLKAMIYHEMAHHIHQFYKEKSAVSPDADKYKRNKFERLLNENFIGHFNPSVYSGTNGEEWFAENYALYKMNRMDLVDDLARDIIEMVEKGENIR